MGNCANDCAKTYCNKDGTETGEVKIEVSYLEVTITVNAIVNATINTN